MTHAAAQHPELRIRHLRKEHADCALHLLDGPEKIMLANEFHIWQHRLGVFAKRCPGNTPHASLRQNGPRMQRPSGDEAAQRQDLICEKFTLHEAALSAEKCPL